VSRRGDGVPEKRQGADGRYAKFGKQINLEV